MFEATGEMNSPRVEHTATLLRSGKVLVAGGGEEWALPPLRSAALYDPRTGTWSATGNMIAARNRHTSILLDDGRVLAVGAMNGDETPELYDPETGIRSATGSLNTPRENATATLLSNGMVLVYGMRPPGSSSRSWICMPTTIMVLWMLWPGHQILRGWPTGGFPMAPPGC